MVEWIVQSAGLLSALAGIVTALSRWAAAREEKLKERAVHDFWEYAESPKGRYRFRQFLRSLEDEQ